jgi:hypothetical protein
MDDLAGSRSLQTPCSSDKSQALVRRKDKCRERYCDNLSDALWLGG